jgi:hypothetical protein
MQRWCQILELFLCSFEWQADQWTSNRQDSGWNELWTYLMALFGSYFCMEISWSLRHKCTIWSHVSFYSIMSTEKKLPCIFFFLDLRQYSWIRLERPSNTIKIPFKLSKTSRYLNPDPQEQDARSVTSSLGKVRSAYIITIFIQRQSFHVNFISSLLVYVLLETSNEKA